VTALLALAASALLLWVPGAALARACGASPAWSAVVAPAVTLGLVGLGTLVLPVCGVRWGVLPLAVLWLALGAGALAARRLQGRLRARLRPASSARRRAQGRRRATGTGTPADARLAVLGVGAAAVVVLVTAWRGGASPTHVNQLWDAVWHANYTTWIASTGQASPLQAGGLYSDWRQVTSYYPDGMHALAALEVQVLGLSAPVVLGAVVLLFAALVLPMAVAALVWVLSEGSGAGAAAGAVLVVLPTIFPVDDWWRPAWPFVLTVCLALLSAAGLLRWLGGRGERGPGAVGVVALCGLGTLAVQPAGVVVGGLLVGGWVVGRAALLPLRRLAWVLPAALAVLAVAALVLRREKARIGILSSVAGYDYRTGTGRREAVTQVLGLVLPVPSGLGYGVPHQAPQLAVTAVLLAGLVLALCRRETLWLGALWGGLVVCAVDTIAPVLRPASLLTGFFYNEPWRMTALVAVVGAVMTGTALGRWAGSVTRDVPAVLLRWRVRPVVARWVAAGAVVALTGVVAATTVPSSVVRLRAGYQPRVLTADQQAVMHDLSTRSLPAGSRVLNDPSDGSAWMYALDGLRPMFVHYNPGPLTPPVQLLLARLDHVDDDPAVQQALRDLKVCVVYDNDRTVAAWTPKAAGFAHLDGVASLQLLERRGSASSYRVLVPGTPCATTPITS
jgi:D-galactosaminyltransferase